MPLLTVEADNVVPFIDVCAARISGLNKLPYEELSWVAKHGLSDALDSLMVRGCVQSLYNCEEAFEARLKQSCDERQYFSCAFIQPLISRSN